MVNFSPTFVGAAVAGWSTSFLYNRPNKFGLGFFIRTKSLEGSDRPIPHPPPIGGLNEILNGLNPARVSL